MTRLLTIRYEALPPSDNHIRDVKTISSKGTRFGRRQLMNVIGYTAEAENFKKEFVNHISATYFDEIQNFALGHTPESVYELTLLLFFPEWELLNKGWREKWSHDSKPGTKQPHKANQRKAKNPYKKLDTLNRRKLLEDGLSEAIGIDDALTWEATVVKLVSPTGLPYIIMSLEERPPKSFGVPAEFLE